MDDPTADDVVIPALLHATRGAYGNAIRERLEGVGLDDLPRNGGFVLGGMGNHGVSASDLIRQLGVSKQSASQLVDTLVVRGYFYRRVNADDRRRMDLDLTDRGRTAAAAIREGVQSVDEELSGMVSADELAGLRKGLIGLCEIRERQEAAGVGRGGSRDEG